MPSPVVLGVIGCGFFAQNHLHSWRDLSTKGAELAAVCDTDPARAKAAAEKFHVPRWYHDPAAMFANERLGLVDIVTRMETHRELVELAVSHRVPTIVQKPFGPDLGACVSMESAARKAGVFLAVHENFRFERPMREIQRILRSGAIGAPSWARISFRTNYDVYKGQPYLKNEDRFVVLDLGVHVLDLARLFLGEVARVSAETQRRNPEVKAEDTATMLLRHRYGAVSVVECTYESRRLPDSFPETLVEIEGDRGAIVLRPNYVMDVTSDGERSSIDVDAPVVDWAERPWHVVQESVFATCAHMLAAVQSGTEADTSAADNIKTFALCEAAYRAMATGRSAEV